MFYARGSWIKVKCMMFLEFGEKWDVCHRAMLAWDRLSTPTTPPHGLGISKRGMGMTQDKPDTVAKA
jgi:hypothetical protein